MQTEWRYRTQGRKSPDISKKNPPQNLNLSFKRVAWVTILDISLFASFLTLALNFKEFECLIHDGYSVIRLDIESIHDPNQFLTIECNSCNDLTHFPKLSR